MRNPQLGEAPTQASLRSETHLHMKYINGVTHLLGSFSFGTKHTGSSVQKLNSEYLHGVPRLGNYKTGIPSA